MSTTEGALLEFMTDAAMDKALELTAQMYGLAKEAVSTIVQVALPMMAKMAERNPELLRQMYAASLATMPVPIEEFYARMLARRALRQATVDDYRALYGSMLDAVHREAGLHVGTTDGQARDILATMMPAVSHALGQANRGGGQAAFARMLGSVAR